MKLDDSTPTHITNPARNGSIRAVNVNLKALMEVAYDIPGTRMVGGPAWITTDKFFVEAKSDPRVDEQLAGLQAQEGMQVKRKMIAALLAERFHLVVHVESRLMPVYVLTVARGGQALSGSVSDSGLPFGGDDHIVIRPGSDSLQILAYELSWRLGKPVLDRTGLQSRQALTRSWQSNDAVSDSGGPSLSTALQEQLGLKLESTRDFVPTIRIDHAERPTGN